jgi:hypothetical protein
MTRPSPATARRRQGDGEAQARRRRGDGKAKALIQSGVDAARARLRRRRTSPALEVGGERGGLEDAARQERQEHARTSSRHSMTSGACSVTERSRLGLNQWLRGASSCVHRVARLAVSDGLGHGGGVLALERAKPRVLDARVPVVAHRLLFFCVGVPVVEHVVLWFGFRVSERI